MGMDVDYVAGADSLTELGMLFRRQEHGEREEFADEIIAFTEKMKEKYKLK